MWAYLMFLVNEKHVLPSVNILNYNRIRVAIELHGNKKYRLFSKIKQERKESADISNDGYSLEAEVKPK